MDGPHIVPAVLFSMNVTFSGAGEVADNCILVFFL